MAKFNIKKWRKKAMSIYGKTRGLSATARKRVTQAVRGKAYKAPATKKQVTKGATKKVAKRGFGTRTIFKWLRIGAFLAPGIIRAAQLGYEPPIRRLGGAMMMYSGLELDGTFHSYLLTRAWLPFVLTSLVTVGVGKLMGIIKRL